MRISYWSSDVSSADLGAGFSSANGPIGNIGIRERNLLGRGQELRLGFTLAGQATELDFSFTEPYFLGRNLAAGVDLYRITSDREDESSYEEEDRKRVVSDKGV